MFRYNRPIRVLYKGLSELIAMLIAISVIAPSASPTSPTKPAICYFPECQLY